MAIRAGRESILRIFCLYFSIKSRGEPTLSDVVSQLIRPNNNRNIEERKTEIIQGGTKYNAKVQGEHPVMIWITPRTFVEVAKRQYTINSAALLSP